MQIRILFLFIFLNIMVKAQVSISGSITDLSNVALEFATVVLKKESTTVSTAYSNEKGGYTLSVQEKGDYTIAVYYVGFDLKEIPVHLSKDTTIHVFLQRAETANLKEITVVNKKLLIEQKVDRLVFNIENSVSATGADALEALKITPGVAVRNDIITMIGKSNLRVMINDKPILLGGDELVNLLKSIPVSNISRIEVITNPSAKYEAEGNSGLINIKLKTAYADSWNATLNSSYTRNTYNTGRAGGSFNYRKNAVSFYSNISTVEGARQIVDQSKMYYPNQLWVNRSPRKVAVSDITGNAGINYALNSKWEIGAQYLGDVSRYKIDNNSLTTLYNQVTENADSTIHTQSVTKENSAQHAGNINATYTLDTLGKRVILNLDYFTYKEDNDNNFYNNNFLSNGERIPQSHYSAQTFNKQKMNNYSGKIDVELPLRNINLSYGGRVAVTRTDNDVSFYNTTSDTPVLDPANTNAFIYTEHNEALYVSAAKKLSKKWEAQLGLRTEATQTKGQSTTLNQINNYNYIKFFPTAYLSYTINENNILVLSYGRRINRPNYEQLNPFRLYSNPYLYIEGNPFLQPSFSDNVELAHTYKNLNSKLYYSNVINGFQQLPIVYASTNSQIITVRNFFHTDLIGLTETWLFNKYEWWESANSFNMFYSRSTSQLVFTRQKLKSFNAFISTSNDFTLNKSGSILLNASYWFNFPGSADLATNTSFSQFDLALKFLLLKKKLTIAVTGRDLFSTNRSIYTVYSNSIKVEYKNYYDDRSIRISLIYKFGNTSLQVEEKEVGNEEERNRTGN